MKCDLCDNPATVQEITLKNGVPVEKNLCEQCAKKQGIAVQPQMPLSEAIMKQMMAKGAGIVISGATTPGAKITARVRALACPACGMTFTQFKSGGLLGCPECYSAFEAQLKGVLERAHEGATHHVGKVPRRALRAATETNADQPEGSPLGTQRDLAQRMNLLKAQLESAVGAEQYELAAELRDELRRLGQIEPPPGSEPTEGRSP